MRSFLAPFRRASQQFSGSKPIAAGPLTKSGHFGVAQVSNHFQPVSNLRYDLIHGDVNCRTPAGQRFQCAQFGLHNGKSAIKYESCG